MLFRMLFSLSKKIDTTCSLCVWAFLTVASRDKRWSLVFAWFCLHIVVPTMFLFGKTISTVLHLPFSPLHCIKHLLERLDDNLKGLLGLFHVFILKLLWTLTIFQRSILADIFCCIEQGESLFLLVEGASTFHCGSYTGHEQIFLWLG